LHRVSRSSGLSALAWSVAVIVLGTFLSSTPAHAQLRLDITQGVRDAVPIAIVPFGGQAEGGPGDVAAVVANDLLSSGRFKPLDRPDMVTRPTTGAQIRFEDWRLLKSDFIVVGRVEPDASGLAVTFELFNVQTGQALLSQRLATTERGLRSTAHRIADLVFERLTGIPGTFSTRIAYVSVTGKAPAQHYRLVVSDADGYNPRTVYMVTFTVGAALSGLAGGVLAPLTGLLPSSGGAYIAKAFITVITGGAAVISGTLSSAIVFGTVNQLVSFAAHPVIGEIAMLALAIILLRLMPRGITGRFFRDGT